MTVHAYCAVPFPNDQFSFGTSKSFAKMFSGPMPGFLAMRSGNGDGVNECLRRRLAEAPLALMQFFFVLSIS